jgi:hypothetical protein
MRVGRKSITYTIPQPLLSLCSNDPIFALRVPLGNQRTAEVLAKILDDGSALSDDYRLFGSRGLHANDR